MAKKSLSARTCIKNNKYKNEGNQIKNLQTEKEDQIHKSKSDLGKYYLLSSFCIFNHVRHIWSIQNLSQTVPVAFLKTITNTEI